MGLDTIELALSVEETFDIEIPDAIAPSLNTLRDLIDYIESLQIGENAHGGCICMRGFNRMRKGLVEGGFCNRNEVKPDAKLDNILPRIQRRNAWRAISNSLGIQLPGLIRPRIVSYFTTALVTLVTFIGAAILYSGPISMLVFATLIGVALGTLAFRITEPLATHLFEDYRKITTIGELVNYVVKRAPKKLLPEATPLSRLQIASTVKALTLDFCDESRYREDGQWVRDLGLD